MSINSLSILECLDDCWETVTPEQLRDLESDLGNKLPDDFLQFLLQHNAGDWRDRAIFIPPDPTDEWDVVTLGLSTGLVPDDEWRLQDIGLVRKDLLAAFPGEFSETLIPIVHTLGGLICIEGAQERYGQIVERSSRVDLDNEFRIRYLAQSFSDFMHGLRRAELLALESIPLFIAVEGGEVQTLGRYLDDGGDSEQRNERGWTLLMSAAHWSWPRLVRLLLEAGADPNTHDYHDLLPMHHATAGGSLDSVKLLLGAGTNLNHRDEQGRNWARVAEEKYQHRIQRFFERLLD